MATANCYRPGPKVPIADYEGPRPETPSPDSFVTLHFSDYPEFQPNCTPQQMFALGIFGGSYFRAIHSAVTDRSYTVAQAQEEFPWLRELPEAWYASPRCQTGVNMYGQFSGLSKEYWETAGWITEHDPYGWVQWYCRFAAGRRCPDDNRQIKRWKRFAGPRGRMRRSALTPTVRQALLQWAVIVL